MKDQNLIQKKSESQILYQTVIKSNYCIGCGACASIDNSLFEIRWNKYGLKIATPIGNLNDCSVKVLDICPFSDRALKEDKISKLFLTDCEKSNIKIGSFIECYSGYVEEGDFRLTGTSGGFIRWLSFTLINANIIDFFVQVMPTSHSVKGYDLFQYQILSDKNEIIKSKAKSAYYPVTLVEIIKYIKTNNGRYAITGVPCFIKALRLLALQDLILKESILFTIGIVCGSMKSANYARSIAWQQGIPPFELKAIDFRVKLQGKPSYIQGNYVSSYNGKQSCKANNDLFGLDYGMGFFKPKACDYCDDVVAETADISLGDAWLPEYSHDYQGTSIVIIRNKKLYDIFQNAMNDKKINVEVISVDKVIKSQEGSFRHRHEGLGYRLYKMKKNGFWFPSKRITPNNKISLKRRKIYNLRVKISKKSHKSFLKSLTINDMSVYYREMDPLVKKYSSLYSEQNKSITPKGITKIILRKIGIYKSVRSIYNTILIR